MESSSRAKPLLALLGAVFLGAVGYLVFGGKQAEPPELKASVRKDTNSLNERKTATGEAVPRCPDCGRELPATGECPYCLLQKKAKNGGKDVDVPVSRFGRFLAWSLVAVTVSLGGAYAAVLVRQHRRSVAPPEEFQLKTRCPRCKRRVKFAAHLEGRYGTCPTCKGVLQFKEVANDP